MKKKKKEILINCDNLRASFWHISLFLHPKCMVWIRQSRLFPNSKWEQKSFGLLLMTKRFGLFSPAVRIQSLHAN